MDCRDELTEIEKELYQFRCEICEDVLFYRLKKFREGKPDMQLEIMFDRRAHSVH